jgi:hypothetical protein
MLMAVNTSVVKRRLEELRRDMRDETMVRVYTNLIALLPLMELVDDCVSGEFTLIYHNRLVQRGENRQKINLLVRMDD